MSKVNKKIYKTIDFQNLAITLAFCVAGLLVFGALSIEMLVSHSEQVLQVLAIFPCGLFSVCTVWSLTWLVLMMVKSNKYTFCESSCFSIAPDSKTLKGAFAINVVIENKTYTTKSNINANIFARAEELKKIEIGILEQNGKTNIVVVKPNQEF